MKTTVITKIYEVKESAKGYSCTYRMCFNKERALEIAQLMNDTYKDSKRKVNFRVYEHTCDDCIIYTTE